MHYEIPALLVIEADSADEANAIAALIHRDPLYEEGWSVVVEGQAEPIVETAA